MNDKQQIEELTRDINDSGMLESESRSQTVAEELYAKGWRKQDESDLVEVVRCKDCKHRNPVCYKCLRDNLWHGTDDFCSYGERRKTSNETQTD